MGHPGRVGSGGVVVGLSGGDGYGYCQGSGGVAGAGGALGGGHGPCCPVDGGGATGGGLG